MPATMPLNPIRSKKLMELSEIGLMLDGYDDIFSDFDPRPYKEKALSVDFLNESKRAAKDKVSGIELKLLIPKAKRSHHTEEIIKERLKAHFKKHRDISKSQRKDVIGKGMLFTLAGMLVMLTATYLLLEYEEGTFFLTFLNVLLEPAGWFLFWEGLDYAWVQAREQKPELDFYEKMHRANIHFMSY